MYARTRERFTREDYDFIASTVADSPSGREAVLRLADDPDAMTDLLHRKILFERSMTSPPRFLTISPHLFFYVFIYQALESKRIAEDDVVDYIAEVCVEFRSGSAFWQEVPSGGGRTIYFLDLLQLLGDVDKQQQYFLRRHIGNVSLFLTGFFPDFIFQRSRKRGAPSLKYYQDIGRAQFGTAAGDARRFEEPAVPVLRALSERFVEIRTALNLYVDSYLRLDARRSPLDVIERQAATLDDESFRTSIDLS